jgi:hypothetical protein
MTNSHLKNAKKSLIIREMQIKTKITITLHLLECLLPKRLKIARTGKDVEKSKPFHNVGGDVNEYSHVENSMCFLKK